MAAMAKESKEARRERQAREESQMIEVLRRAGNTIEPEARVCNDRRWRVDYLINGRVAMEIQGWGFGHVGRAGWLRDIEKAQQCAINRWYYVPLTREQVANGDGLEVLARMGLRVQAG